METKNLSKGVLTDSCRILAGLGSSKISLTWAKMAPRWQDPPSWGQDGHLEAIWGAFSSIFVGLGSDL